MSGVDDFAFRFLLASGGCLLAGLGVWALTLLLRRLPGLRLQRSPWLLAQLTIVAAFLVLLLPHSERLRLVPPIELDSTTGAGAGLSVAVPGPLRATTITSADPRGHGARPWLAYGARAWLIAYLFGLTCCIVKLLRARALLTGLARAGCKVSHLAGHEGLAGAGNTGPALEVIEVDASISPLLFGFFKSRLLLPRHLRSFDPLQQQLIVEHELTHLRRRDLHWLSASLVLQTILWFNPFMRLLHRQLTWAQELGCDRDVLAGRPRAQRKAYAAALVAQLASQHRPMSAALAFGGVEPHTVAARISLIREPAMVAPAPWTRFATLGALALASGASLALQPAFAWRSDVAQAAVALDCTAITDAASGVQLAKEGQCDERVTPASTFNIVVSLMGYDSGILVDEHTPALPFKPGYTDAIPAWRATTDPARWIRHSVLWFAQQVTARLGAARFQRYIQQFNYGNQDVSGDPGQHNGLSLSWVGSSLKISPAEQLVFLSKLVNRQLPVSATAHAMTERIMLSQTLANGWVVHGKTGTASPVLADGRDDPARQYGWYVGWAKKGERTLVFARLVLLARQEGNHAGPRVKEAFLPVLAQRLNTL